MRIFAPIAAVALVAAGCAQSSAAPGNDARQATTRKMALAQRIGEELDRECADGLFNAPLMLTAKDAVVLDSMFKLRLGIGRFDSLRRFYHYSYRQAMAELESYSPAERSHWHPDEIDQIAESTYVAIYMTRYEQREFVRLREIALGQHINKPSEPHP